MRRVALYSSSRKSRQPARSSGTSPPLRPEENRLSADTVPVSSSLSNPPPLLVPFIRRHRTLSWFFISGLLSLLLAWGYTSMKPSPRPITQKDIDRAVLHALETQTLPSPAAKAYEVIMPSVVRVRGLDTDPDGDDEIETKVGSGVVVVDKGLILTNLHVVRGTRLVKVVFADGMVSEAVVAGLQPENDLAVLQAKTIPDDLTPANLGSTRDLAVGDHVVAVGFPFGIGPSVSAGVVSGLNREFRSSEGQRLLTGLIQFDAAANLGNSGGPLVNAKGEVVGIVTAILNPTDQRVFIGIGFAVTMESAAMAIGLPPF